MKTFKGFLYGLAVAIVMSASAATVYNYFPPPGITYSPTTGTVFGTATGGAQGVGTVNAQGLFVNGTAVNTGGAPGSNTQVIYNSSGLLAASSLLTFTPGTVVVNIGAATTPGTFSVGQLDAMVVNGVTVPIPGFALNSSIQGVFENHSYVNGVSSGGARYYGVRSEGTISSPAIVVNGDHLSTFYAAGYNGSSYSLGGDILFQVSGTPGASAMPSDMLVQLSPTGSQVPVTVATFSHTGNVAIGVPQSGASALTVNGVASSPALTVQGNTGTGTGQGVLIQAGTNSSDYAWLVKNAAGSTTMAQLFGDGGLVLNGATGGDQGAGTLNMSGCFVNGVACSTGGASGANPTGTVGLTVVNGVAGSFMRSDASPPLSQSIAPTWTGTHLFTGAVTSSGGTTGVSIGNRSGTAAVHWDNSSGATDAKRWEAIALNSTQLEFRALNDASTVAGAFLNVTRSGAAITAVSFGNATDNPTYTFLGSGAVSANSLIKSLSGTEANISATGVVLFGANPAVLWQNNSGAADTKIWDCEVNSATDFLCRAVNDAFGSANSWLDVNRTGVTINSVTFPNGGMVAGSPTGGSKGTGTLNATGLYVNGTLVVNTGTFTATLTGMTATVTGTMNYTAIAGKVCTMWPASAILGTSNANTFTITGLPAACTPSASHGVNFGDTVSDNGVAAATGVAEVGSNSIITMGILENGTSRPQINNNAWTTSGTKGINSDFAITFPL